MKRLHFPCKSRSGGPAGTSACAELQEMIPFGLWELKGNRPPHSHILFTWQHTAFLTLSHFQLCIRPYNPPNSFSYALRKGVTVWRIILYHSVRGSLYNTSAHCVIYNQANVLTNVTYQIFSVDARMTLLPVD